MLSITVFQARIFIHERSLYTKESIIFFTKLEIYWFTKPITKIKTYVASLNFSFDSSSLM